MADEKAGADSPLNNIGDHNEENREIDNGRSLRNDDDPNSREVLTSESELLPKTESIKSHELNTSAESTNESFKDFQLSFTEKLAKAEAFLNRSTPFPDTNKHVNKSNEETESSEDYKKCGQYSNRCNWNKTVRDSRHSLFLRQSQLTLMSTTSSDSSEMSDAQKPPKRSKRCRRRWMKSRSVKLRGPNFGPSTSSFSTSEPCALQENMCAVEDRLKSISIEENSKNKAFATLRFKTKPDQMAKRKATGSFTETKIGNKRRMIRGTKRNAPAASLALSKDSKKLKTVHLLPTTHTLPKGAKTESNSSGADADTESESDYRETESDSVSASARSYTLSVRASKMKRKRFWSSEDFKKSSSVHGKKLHPRNMTQPIINLHCGDASSAECTSNPADSNKNLPHNDNNCHLKNTNLTPASVIESIILTAFRKKLTGLEVVTPDPLSSSCGGTNLLPSYSLRLSGDSRPLDDIENIEGLLTTKEAKSEISSNLSPSSHLTNKAQDTTFAEPATLFSQPIEEILKNRRLCTHVRAKLLKVQKIKSKRNSESRPLHFSDRMANTLASGGAISKIGSLTGQTSTSCQLDHKEKRGERSSSSNAVMNRPSENAKKRCSATSTQTTLDMVDVVDTAENTSQSNSLPNSGVTTDNGNECAEEIPKISKNPTDGNMLNDNKQEGRLSGNRHQQSLSSKLSQQYSKSAKTLDSSSFSSGSSEENNNSLSNANFFAHQDIIICEHCKKQVFRNQDTMSSESYKCKLIAKLQMDIDGIKQRLASLEDDNK